MADGIVGGETVNKIQKALNNLNTLIEAGREFPDVVGRIARLHGLKEETLTRAYDAQFD